MAGGVAGEQRSVVGRALAVLDTFSSDRPELTLGTIVADTGLPSATAYRLVAELVAWGALEKVGRGRYRVGMRLWQVGSLAPVARGLRDAALPVLQDLCAATGHGAHLVVLDGHHALFLERLAGHSGARPRSQVGRGMPLHASGPGKVLLAHASPEFVAEVVARGLPRVASRTITDPRQLAVELAAVRAAGHCLSRDEMTDGVASVAAPVRDRNGTVVAGLSVVVPTATPLLQFVPAVRVAAAGVSRAIGSPLSGNSA